MTLPEPGWTPEASIGHDELSNFDGAKLPAVAVTREGDFLLVYSDDGIWARRYSVARQQWDEVFRVSDLATSVSGHAVVATDEGAAVAWWDVQRNAVCVRRFVDGSTWATGWNPVETVAVDPPETVRNSFYQLAATPSGDLAAVWERWDSNTGVHSNYFRLYAAGVGWGSPVELGDLGENGVVPRIALLERDGGLKAIVSWWNNTASSVAQGRTYDYDRATHVATPGTTVPLASGVSGAIGVEDTRAVGDSAAVLLQSRSPFQVVLQTWAGEWQPPVVLGDGNVPTLAVAPNGGAIVAFVNTEQALTARRRVAGDWQAPEVVANVQRTVSPSVAVNDSGAALVVWTDDVDQVQTIYARGYDPAVGWSDVHHLAIQGAYLDASPAAVLSPSGIGLAAWQRTVIVDLEQSEYGRQSIWGSFYYPAR